MAVSIVAVTGCGSTSAKTVTVTASATTVTASATTAAGSTPVPTTTTTAPGQISFTVTSTATTSQTQAAAPLPRFSAGTYTGIKPSEIDFSGDGGNIVTRISWSTWTATRANGKGLSDIQSCVPSCVQGSNKTVTATLVLSEPRDGRFTELVETRNGQTSAVSYGSSGWPFHASS